MALYSVALLTSLVQSCGTEDAKVLYCYIIIIIIIIFLIPQVLLLFYFYFYPDTRFPGNRKKLRYAIQKSTKIKLE